MATIALAARAYQQSFEARPRTTLAVTNGSLFAIGDGVAQLTQLFTYNPDLHRGSKRPLYDIARTARFFAFGVGMGPLLGRWNRFLEHRFPLRGIATSNRVSISALGKRVAADQLFMAPIGLAMFIGSMGVMEGRDAQHIGKKYEDIYTPAIIANWRIWPLAQFINFRYMALPYRIPFQSTCGIFWNLYLSLLNSKENERQDESDALRMTLE